MSRPHAPLEVTCRTIQGRFLLMPSRRLNELLLGVVGRAQSLCPAIKIYLFVVMSNHLHMILSAPDSATLSRFMCHLNGNLAKEAGRLYDWPGKFWEGRYHKIEVMDHESLMQRVHYLLSHGCKEGMVNRPEDWPGVNCVKALTTGKPLSGVWVDRAAMWDAGKNKGDLKKYETRYEIRLATLPGFDEMSEKKQRKEWKRIVKGIKEEYVNNPVKDPLMIARDPHHRPDSMKKSPQPMCHASTDELRKLYREAYELFVMAYRDAQERFHAGDPKALEIFPPGCFIPPFARPYFDSG